MKKNMFIILLLIGSLGQISSDLYLPSLPAIQSQLMTDINLVQWSVAVFMFGYALSQLFYGPISDAIGRKKPLLFGTILLFLGDIICLSANNIEWLIAGRAIQGIGAGSMVTMSRAILRDVYSGAGLAKFASYLSIGSVSIMASAPLLGGYIQEWYNWHGNFMFLTLWTLIILAIILIQLPETNQHKDISHIKINQWLKNIKILLTHRVFVSMSALIFLTYGAVLAWLTASPVLLQHLAGLSPIVYGWMVGLVGIASITGSLANGKLLGRFSMWQLLMAGSIGMFLGGASMLLLAVIFKSVYPIIIVIPMLILLISCSFVFANAFAGAMSPFPKIAGVAGSIFGGMQILGGAALSGIMAHIDEMSQMPLAWTLVVTCGLIVLISLSLKKQLCSN